MFGNLSSSGHERSGERGLQYLGSLLTIRRGHPRRTPVQRSGCNHGDVSFAERENGLRRGVVETETGGLGASGQQPKPLPPPPLGTQRFIAVPLGNARGIGWEFRARHTPALGSTCRPEGYTCSAQDLFRPQGNCLIHVCDDDGPLHPMCVQLQGPSGLLERPPK